MCATSITKTRLMELCLVCIISKIAEAHHSSENSEDEGSQLESLSIRIKAVLVASKAGASKKC